MKNTVKLLALLLALVMVLGLAACTAKPSTTTEEPTAPETETTAPAEAKELSIGILYEQDDAMINNYSLLAVNPDAPFADADGNPISDVAVNTVGAKAFIDWMLTPDTLKTIGDYGFDEYGEYLFYIKEDAPKSSAEIPMATEETKLVRVSTTTSVNDSGLLDYVVPMFEEAYGYDVEVFSAGTGKAIANAKAGNADLILVHSKTQEEDFVKAGFSMVEDGFETERLTFMYNYFVLVGPKDDPAGCKNAASVKDAFKLISDGKYTFISRGDGSGTHTKELSLWDESLGITDQPESVQSYSWYQFSNAGMGVCLTMANEQGAYILSDKATFLTFQANGGVIE